MSEHLDLNLGGWGRTPTFTTPPLTNWCFSLTIILPEGWGEVYKIPDHNKHWHQSKQLPSFQGITEFWWFAGASSYIRVLSGAQLIQLDKRWSAHVFSSLQIHSWDKLLFRSEGISFWIVKSTYVQHVSQVKCYHQSSDPWGIVVLA
jgi:hypothetical protein